MRIYTKMRVFVFDISRLHSLLRRPEIHTIFTDFVIHALDAPISELYNLLVQNIIEKLHRHAVCNTQLRPPLHMPLVCDTPVNCDRQRHITTAMISQPFE